MKKTVRVVCLMGLVGLLSACVNMNKNVKQDLNVMSARLDTLERSVSQLSVQQTELREIVSGEQKRGEYLQRQISQGQSRSSASVAAVTNKKKIKPNVSKEKEISYSDGKKFISNRMPIQPAVTDVQLALRNAGFYDGAIDGAAGPQTRQAVKAYQRSEGLRDDGVIGRRTWSKLSKYS